ncbi:MAG: hypothetical protein MHM6MM_006781 [Cercozoa sp. M6MM]
MISSESAGRTCNQLKLITAVQVCLLKTLQQCLAFVHSECYATHYANSDSRNTGGILLSARSSSLSHSLRQAREIYLQTTVSFDCGGTQAAPRRQSEPAACSSFQRRGSLERELSKDLKTLVMRAHERLMPQVLAMFPNLRTSDPPQVEA